MNNIVDSVVDKAAAGIKSQVKMRLGGGSGQKAQSGGSGGIGGLFPSAGDGGSKGGKSKGGGLLDGFLKSEPKAEPKPEPRPQPNPVAENNAAGGANEDFDGAVDELCKF